jgi:hypothetical protein
MLVPKRGKPPITTWPGGKVSEAWLHTVTYGIYDCANADVNTVPYGRDPQLSEAS